MKKYILSLVLMFSFLVSGSFVLADPLYPQVFATRSDYSMDFFAVCSDPDSCGNSIFLASGFDFHDYDDNIVNFYIGEWSDNCTDPISSGCSVPAWSQLMSDGDFQDNLDPFLTGGLKWVYGVINEDNRDCSTLSYQSCIRGYADGYNIEGLGAAAIRSGIVNGASNGLSIYAGLIFLVVIGVMMAILLVRFGVKWAKKSVH